MMWNMQPVGYFLFFNYIQESLFCLRALQAGSCRVPVVQRTALLLLEQKQDHGQFLGKVEKPEQQTWVL